MRKHIENRINIRVDDIIKIPLTTRHVGFRLVHDFYVVDLCNYWPQGYYPITGQARGGLSANRSATVR